MSFALKARVVFPVDRPPIENGVVLIDRERIVAVGAKTHAGAVIDLGNVALLPGLVNCHTHLEFSGLRWPLGSAGMQLVDWIRLVIAERGGGAKPQAAVRMGVDESVRFGVTTIGDILGQGEYDFDRSADVTQFVEVIGFSRAREESAYTAVCERLDRLGNSSRVHVGISPHAPYTVSPSLLSRLIALAKERAMPVAMHLAESVEELELLDTGAGPFQELLDERSMWDAEAIPRESRPIDYLRMLRNAPRALVVHGNYLGNDEHSFLAAHRDRMSLIYCPRTHAFFRHPPYPLAELIKKNVRVGLGTDSRASNPDLDLLAEMRLTARTFPAIDPEQVLRMGTLDGAEALGRGAEVGSIAPGKVANLVVVPLAELHRSPSDTLLELFARDDAPCGVWVRGVRLTS